MKSKLQNILENENNKEAAIESLLDFYPSEIEKEIESNKEEIYAGLDQRAFSTPFVDYYSILKDMNPNTTLVDLGAGYCKASILSQALKLPIKAVSVEYEKRRVDYAKKYLSNPEDAIVFDICSEKLPVADAYYLYLPLGELIFTALEQLLERDKEVALYVSEAHGDVIDFFLNTPRWFQLEKVMPSEAKRHTEGIYKYIFTPNKIDSIDWNSAQALYGIVQYWSKDPNLLVEKESGKERVSVKSLLPIKRNKQMQIEALTLKRIVDFRLIKLIMGQ